MSGKGAQMFGFVFAVISQIGFGRIAQDSLGGGIVFSYVYYVKV